MAWGTNWFTEAAPVSEQDLASGVIITKTSIVEDTLKVEHIETAKVYANKVPTHDPYTNPDAHIYYSCECGEVLDPGTKRFAELNNCASRSGWKIRFGEVGYTPYCPKCAEGLDE